MPFAGLELSCRLERAEGHACRRFAEARSRLFPSSGAAWLEHLYPRCRLSKTSTRGWTHEHPELRRFLDEIGAISFAREEALCFLADYEGQPGAAGALCLHDGVALFAGSATVPELRRRGLQRALLQARLRAALERGCDLAMMVAEPGSESQRNAERQGFRIAYTRIKWRLESHAP